MFMHFSIILIVFKQNFNNFKQETYDNFFHCIENNLRELGFGDVAVNKKMKEFNKILYDILLKINKSKTGIDVNEKLIIKYFEDLKHSNSVKYKLFDQYFINFYHFCFELSPENMIKDAIDFKVK